MSCNPELELELETRLMELRGAFEIIPFMTALHPVSGMQWKLLPDEALALLVGSADYRPVMAGAAPTWFDITGPEESLTLVVYRPRSDEQFYVLAPQR